MTAVSLNNEQRLFVIPSGGGYSCLGFDHLFKRLSQYASILGWASPREEEVGTLEQYRQFREAERAYILSNPKDVLYDPETPQAVIDCLERYRRSGEQVRIFLGDHKTGRDWLEEFDVLGRISSSMGPIRVPLMVSRNSSGGPAILTAHIVRIVDAKTKQQVYRSANYKEPVFTMATGDTPGLPIEVSVNEVMHARFKTQAKATAYIEFMQGKRMTKSAR